MYHKVEIDFGLNLIKSRSYTIESSNFRNKCCKFKLNNEISHSRNSVKLTPEKIINEPWLFGPAAMLQTRTIVYPCSRFKCAIPCPCLLCAKKHPTCRVPSSKPCSCQDCSNQFEDHTSYHAVFHYGCKFCFQLVKTIANFNFFFMDTEKKLFPSGCYDSNSPLTPNFCQPDHKISVEFLKMWCKKKDKWLSGQEDAMDMWCKGCNVLYWSFETLREHINRKHLGTKIFWHHCYNTAEKEDCSTKCYQCSKNFASVKDLQRHIESVHYEDYHVCDVCGVSFTREDSLKRHKTMKHKNNSDDPNLSCKECGKHFTRIDVLKRHVSIVHTKDDKAKFRCDLCPSMFNREANLTRHVENMFQKDGTFKHACDKCAEKFCTTYLLVEHIKSIHSEIRAHSCALCLKTFHSKMELEKHTVAVHNDQEFKCLLCPQTFTKEGNLDNHKLLIHKNDSLGLKCLMCNTVFKNKFSFDRHKEQIEVGGTPRYLCQECNERFCTSKLLRAHANSMHSSYVCDFCDNNFLKRSNLNVHIQKRMNQSVLCKTCGKQCCNFLLLKIHMKKEH